ncbi:MAG: DUF5916 domain-containing protein [bacterium]
MFWKPSVLFLSILLITRVVVTAQSDSTNNPNKKSVRTYTTTRLTTEEPEIDGVLDDACWQTGVWAGDFTQWIPKEGAKPSQPTYLKILFDDGNIYAAIRAVDHEPEKISVRAGKRDEFQGDMVGINFDSYHDHRTGFEFNLTSAGQKIDLLLSNPVSWDVNWNAVWYGKVGFEDSAWTAEFQIPLSQLRFSSDEEQVWGMHCWRWIDRLQEESDWEPQSSTGPGVLFQFGELHGIKGLPSSRRIEIMPYLLGRAKTFKSEPGNPFADKGRSFFGNAGIDAKIGLSSNFTADLTINPDFGQVESDPSVMNLTAFETYYEERRPFFLEASNIFSFPFDNSSLFYSRRIGHTPAYIPSLGDKEYIDLPDNSTILSAVKISGKTADGLAIGVLQSLTANEKAIVNSSGSDKDISVEPLTNYFITRITKDFEEGNTVLGGIFTSTNRFINDAHLEFMNRNAFTGGIDFLHHWNDKEFYIDAKLVGSAINGTSEAMRILQSSSARYYHRPDADHFDFDSTITNLTGHGGRIRIGKGSKGLWRYHATLNWRSPGLDFNDLGYMSTSDIFKEENYLSYFVNQPEFIFRTYTLSVYQFNNWDYGMNHLSSGGSASVYLEFLNNWAISTSLSYTGQALNTRLLRGGNAMLVPAVWSYNFYAKTDPSEKMFFDLSTNISLSENNSYRYYSIQPGVWVIPINTLKISVSLNYSSGIDNLQYVDTKSINGEDIYLLGKIDQHTLGATFRIDYNITPELSIQYYGSPFASVGKYSEFKCVTSPQADKYEDRYSKLNPSLNGNDYEVYNNSQLEYSFSNPDFNFSQFRSNLVLRWEYRPGSQFYLVWSQDRTNYIMPGQDSVSESFGQIRNLYPNNIFLLKFNYWFSI